MITSIRKAGIFGLLSLLMSCQSTSSLNANSSEFNGEERHLITEALVKTVRSTFSRSQSVLYVETQTSGDPLLLQELEARLRSTGYALGNTPGAAHLRLMLGRVNSGIVVYLFMKHELYVFNFLKDSSGKWHAKPSVSVRRHV